MTIHRAKGLEFPVVCVADLGRPAAPGPRAAAGRPRRQRRACGCSTLERRRHRPGARLRRASRPRWRRGGGGGAAAALRGDDPRRGAADPLRRDRPGRLAGRRPGRRADRLARARAARAPDRRADRRGAGPHRRARVGRHAPHGCACGSTPPATLDAALRGRAVPATAARPRRRSGTALPAEPTRRAAAPRPGPPPRGCPTRRSRLRRCAYRFYLERVLGLARAAPPRPPPRPRARPRSRVLDPRLRGSLVHGCSRPRLRPPGAPAAEAVAAAGTRRTGSSWSDAEVADIRALVAAFADSPLRARLAAAPRRPPRGAVRVRARPRGSAAPLVTGFVDVLARERDGTALVVDYKTDRLDGRRARRARRARLRRPARWSTRSPRCAPARRASRSPTASSSAPGEPVVARFDAARRARAREELIELAGGRARGRVSRRAAARTATCAATARAGARCAPGRVDDAARDAAPGLRSRRAPSPAAAGPRSRAAARASGGGRSRR